MNFEQVMENLGRAVEAVGAGVIVMGAVMATAVFAYRVFRRDGDFHTRYRSYRQGLGRAILLGLEFLVAGDIIGTVAVDPSFRSVGVLAAVVGIRTFLSFALEVELSGRWPWEGEGTADPS